jgi:hypothetical protein
VKLLLFNIFCSCSILAQLPETDIWLFKITKKENVYIYTDPLNVTHRAGYDNQPTFSADGKSILYVCIDSTDQADIYQYNINKKSAVNITKSDVSEYSPTVMPNGSGFSCVVVEKDSAQRVWTFSMNGKFNSIVHAGTDSIGYHTWLNEDTLLYYKLTEPHSLRVLNIKTNDDHWLCDHPTRAFKKINRSSAFVYALKDSVHTEFRIYNPTLRESTLYTTYPTSTEDFIWHPVFGLVKSENADLIRYNEHSKTWDVLFSFSNLGIKKITRFTFDSKTKQLAIVNNL